MIAPCCPLVPSASEYLQSLGQRRINSGRRGVPHGNESARGYVEGRPVRGKGQHCQSADPPQPPPLPSPSASAYVHGPNNSAVWRSRVLASTQARVSGALTATIRPEQAVPSKAPADKSRRSRWTSRRWKMRQNWHHGDTYRKAQAATTSQRKSEFRYDYRSMPLSRLQSRPENCRPCSECT